MFPFGKTLFAVMGWLSLGMVGLFLGLVAGHVLVDDNGIVRNFQRRFLWFVPPVPWERIIPFLGAFSGALGKLRKDPFKRAGRLETARDKAFIQSMAVLMTTLLKIDSSFFEKKVELFKQAFNPPPQNMRRVEEIFHEAYRADLPFEPYARQLKSMFETAPAVYERIVVQFFKFAQMDANISIGELEYLATLGKVFEIDPERFKRITSHYQPKRRSKTQTPSRLVNDPYQVLDVPRTATDAEVKRIYRELIRTNHPDTAVAQGVSPEEAHRRMSEINAAYEVIAKIRGMT